MSAILEGEDRLGLKEALDRSAQSGLVSAVLYPDDPEWNFQSIHDYCYERGFTIYPGKLETERTFRLCAMGMVDEQDIRLFWDVFEDALASIGVRIPVIYHKACNERNVSKK